MRIAQMRRREDFDAILLRTLRVGWSEEFGHPVHVTREPMEHAQPFRVQPVIGAFFTADLCREGRRFLRDSIRFTPHRARLPIQWMASEVLTSPPAMRLGTRSGFWVTPGFPKGHTRLVIPGNQRVRVFDFDKGVTRVFLKDGFDKRTMLTEIALRMGKTPGPFLPIRAACPEGGFLEEKILSGWDLARTPPWHRPQRLRKKAFKTLLRWLERTGHRVETARFLDEVRANYLKALAIARRRFDADLPPYLEGWADILAEMANAGSVLDVAQSHGDFQAGNIFVTRERNDIILIDWEHSAQRSREYDLLTEGLASRSSRGIAHRIAVYISGGRLHSPADDLGLAKRRQAVALFLLEDLTFYLRESVSGPFSAISEGLSTYITELTGFGTRLQLLQRRGA